MSTFEFRNMTLVRRVVHGPSCAGCHFNAPGVKELNLCDDVNDALEKSGVVLPCYEGDSFSEYGIFSLVNNHEHMKGNM